MAEVVGLAASVLQIGGAGAKLSTELYNFISTASRAETEIELIANDVQSTSQVLGNVGKVLDSDDAKKLVNTDAVQHAKDLIKQCEEVFNELSDVVLKARRPAGQGKSLIGFRAKIAWPMKEQRVELLRRRLETLKSSLAVLFHVLQLAHDKARGDVELTYLEEQKQTIRSLHQQQQTSLVILQALEKKLCTDTAVPVQVSTTPVPAPTPQPVLTVFTAPTISAPNAQSQLQRNDTAEELFKDLGPDTSDTDTAMTGSEGEGEHLTVDELAHCAKQVQKLLRRITVLQESLNCGAAEGRHKKRRMHKVYRRFCRKFEGAVGLDGDGRLTKTVSGETFIDSQSRRAAVPQQSAGRPQVSELQQRLAFPDAAGTDRGRRRPSPKIAAPSPPSDTLDISGSSTTPGEPVVSYRRPTSKRLDSRSNHCSDLHPTRSPRPERHSKYFDSRDEGTSRTYTNRGYTCVRPQAASTQSHDRTSIQDYEQRYTLKRQLDEPVPRSVPEHLTRASQRPVRGVHELRPVLEPPSRFLSRASEQRPPLSRPAQSSSRTYYVYESSDYESSESPSRSERTGDRDDRTRPSRRVYRRETSPRRSVPLRRRSSPRPKITERPTPARTPWSHAFVRSRRLSLDSADDGLPPPPLQVEGCSELTRARIDDRKTNVSSPSQTRLEDPLTRETHMPPLNSSLLEEAEIEPSSVPSPVATRNSTTDLATLPKARLASKPLTANATIATLKKHGRPRKSDIAAAAATATATSSTLVKPTVKAKEADEKETQTLAETGPKSTRASTSISSAGAPAAPTIATKTQDYLMPVVKCGAALVESLYPREARQILKTGDGVAESSGAAALEIEKSVPRKRVRYQAYDSSVSGEMGAANDDWGLDFYNVNVEYEKPTLDDFGTKSSQSDQKDAQDGEKTTEVRHRSPSKELLAGSSITGEQPERLLAKRGEQPQLQVKGKKSKIEPEKRMVRDRPRIPSGQVPTKRRREGPTLEDVHQKYQQRAGMERAAAPQDALAHSPGPVIIDAQKKPQDEGIMMPNTRAEELAFAGSEKTSAEKARKRCALNVHLGAGEPVSEGEVSEQRQESTDYYDPRGVRTSRPSAQSPTRGFNRAWQLQPGSERGEGRGVRTREQNQRYNLRILHDHRRCGLGMVGPFGRSEKAERTVVDAAPAPVLEVEKGAYACDLEKNHDQDGEPMDIVDVLLERWTRPVSCG